MIKNLIICSIWCLVVGCGTNWIGNSKSDDSQNGSEDIKEPEKHEVNVEDQKYTLATCVLTGEEEGSCLAYRIVEASLGEGLQPKDLPAKNYTLKCISPEGGDVQTCKDFRAEVKK
jgi:hypothetical protein